MYAYKVDCLRELEKLARERVIDLFYGEESHVCSEGYVPYSWQFPGEDLFIASSKGLRLNCFAMISRRNQCHWATTTQSIGPDFIVEQLQRLSFKINKPTFLVLDCPRIYTGKKYSKELSIGSKEVFTCCICRLTRLI